MRRTRTQKHTTWQRLGALTLALLMVIGLLPTDALAAQSDDSGVMGQVQTIADPDTIRRHDDVYGDNTLNAGKVTVGKSVSDDTVQIKYDGETKTATFDPAEDNFIVTVSQTSQVAALTSESAVPVDVVFVLDTSGSMNQYGVNRASSMVTAANSAIATLMEANPYNRVAVVAFSSNSYGGGTSQNAAANVLSSLKHYDGEAATQHLRWTEEDGEGTGSYIAGRDTVTVSSFWGQTTRAATRHGYSGGTNIQAGIIEGAKLLTANSNTTTVQTEYGTVTRMPFIMILSDGQPTFSLQDATWYSPTTTTQQGNGSSAYAGNGFLPALTAAYYKAKITEKYYGAAASEKNRCSIYTVGVQLNEELAEITLNPRDNFKPTVNDYYNTFKTYWDNFTKQNPEDFTIKVNNSRPENYTVTANSIRAARNAVMGKNSAGVTMYEGGLVYNDDHFAATSTDEIAEAFTQVVTSIQKQAMASPTHVDTSLGEDFSGYVNFNDPIGEYMEVKGVQGLLINGTLQQGKTTARYLEDWDNAPPAFKTEFMKVLQERCEVTGATMDPAKFIEDAVKSENQAYYKDENDFNNSLVWWGQSYTPEGEEDPHVQWIGFADDDSVEYITDPTTTIPANADYVCRSYYFYGTSGNASATPEEEMLHLVVRVQRSLTAPYEQTVVVSVPASLLSVEEILINEKMDNNNRPVYTAEVTKTDPVRVVYEVGLRSDINAFNVESILKEDGKYLAETDQNGNLVNYVNGEYRFYTNDWVRDADMTEHHRAMAKATFDAAATNSFYAYTKDTQILKKNGNSYVPYTGNSAPVGTYYYARTYYEWSDDTQNADGTYGATEKTAYIEVNIPAGAKVTKKADGWYINKGVFTASSLVTNADVDKKQNLTETALHVSHPHRTEDDTNSHYTVMLGNNGRLSLKGEKTKSVDITKADNTVIINADGKPVMVGDTLTYKIRVPNYTDGDVTADVTDKIPAGTAYVADSASHDGQLVGDTVTWTAVPVKAGETEVLTFKVQVTEAVLDNSNHIATIDNTAHVKLGNDFEFDTNPTKNPPEGKKVSDASDAPITGGVQVPDVLIYRIRWYNSADTKADVTITDQIPAGATYVPNSASHPEYVDFENNTLTWTFEDVEPGMSGTVSFRVYVNAQAGATVENQAQIEVENDPYVRVTNKPTVEVKKGNLEIKKEVTGYPTNAPEKTFNLTITDIGLYLDGEYDMKRNGADAGKIKFTNGQAPVTIKDNDTLEILGLPAGSILSVTEAATPGFTATYKVDEVTSNAEGRVTIPANDAASVEITNAYAAASATFQLQATKKLNTEAVVGNINFGFLVYKADAEGKPITDIPATGEVVVSSDDNEETVVFSPATFTEAGVYHYLIEEVKGGAMGVQYTTKQYLLTITVTDNGTGQLSASATVKSRDKKTDAFGAASSYDENSVRFTNAYVPLETSITLTGEKSLTGRNMAAGEFSFEVKEGGNVVSTGTNDKDGDIIFKPITYQAKDIGVHTYTITEVKGGKTGVSYDTKTVTVKVNVAYNQSTGELEYDIMESESDDISFSNTFTPTGVDVILEGKKTLKDHEGNKLNLTEKAFNFVVKEGDKTVSTGYNKADGTIAFNKIGYTVLDVGTHTYKVTEVKPDLVNPNMYYDPTEFTVTVTVTYDEDTGELKASAPQYSKPIAFENIQNPDTVEVTIQGKKTTDNAPDENLTFSFSVVNTATGVEATSGVGKANGDITFGKLNFSEVGTYTYWILESNAGNTTNGITYDQTRYLMKVEVTRNATNKLEKTVTYYASDVDGSTDVADYTKEVTKPEFKNEYNAGGYINLTAKKELSGRELNAGEFAFKLVRENGGEIDGIMDKNGNITFATMYYSLADLGGEDVKVITYTMSEVIPSSAKLPGVIYDNHTYKIYVQIADEGNGTISAELVDENGVPSNSNTNDTGVVFKNTYDPVKVTIAGTKTLTGRNMAKEEFSFELYHLDGDNEILVATAKNTAAANDGEKANFSFTREYLPNILADYNGSRTIKYAIKEVNNNLGGVHYDTDVIYVKVVVKDEGVGMKLDSVTYYSDKACNNRIDRDDVAFQNIYDPADAKITPTVKKELTGRTLQAGEFSFLLQKDGKTIATATNAADGTVTFAELTYGHEDLMDVTPVNGVKSKEFTYTITEVKGNLPGVTYKLDPITLTVTVTDDGEGEMTASAAYSPSDKTIRNTYEAEDTNLHLKAEKILTGRDMAQGEFSFLVTDVETGKVKATGGNAAAEDGQKAEVTFSAIGFEDAGEYIFRIEETNTAQGGVDFSGAVYFAKVTVVDNNTTGKLEVKDVTYHTAQTCTAANKITEVLFQNTYTPDSVTVALPTDKTLINKALVAEEFNFILKDSNGNVLQTKSNAADGSVAFEDLEFTHEMMAGATENSNGAKVKQFVYTVSEEVGTKKAPGTYTLDDPFTVVVTVTDDGMGKLHAQIGYYVNYKGDGSDQNLGGIEFINHYTAPPLTIPLTEQIKATKTLTGRQEAMKAGEFTFKVYDIKNNVIATGANDASGKITFTNFTFDKAGEYHYWIVEDATSNGVVRDERVWDLHIQVRYNETTGLLYVEDADVKTHPQDTADHGATMAPKFVNTYVPTPVKVELTAQKKLTGRDGLALKAGEFTFRLMENDYIVAETTNDANGNITFHLDYTKAGNHNYTIVEVAKNGNGITSSNASFNVSVKITDDQKGTLSADVSYSAADRTFENIYKPAKTEAVIQAKKIMIGDKRLGDEVFRFQLEHVSDPSQNQILTNDSNGDIISEPLTFTKAGKYTINLSELDCADDRIAEDPNTYEIIVDVVDNWDGTLTATVVYPNDTVPTFVNTFKAKPVEVSLTAKKRMEGRELQAGEKFTFAVYDSHGTKIKEATNDDAGNITFPSIRFTAEGTYTLTVKEIAGTDSAITYDATEYTVVVTVTNTDGVLSYTVAYPDGDMEFSNVYKADDVTVALQASKKLTGRDMTAGEFRFTAKEVNGTKTATGTNAAAADGKTGTVTFDPITITHADMGGAAEKAFIFKLTENVVIQGGVTAGGNVYYAKVVVKDNVNTGKLEIVSTGYYTDETCNNAAEALFVNTYAPAAASAKVEATKTMVGDKTLGSEVFNFQLVNKDDKSEVHTATNDATGKITFALNFEEAGTYHYVMSEQDYADDRITKDEKTYDVTVTVTDNLDGTMTAVVTYADGQAPTFVNTFKADPTSAKILAKKVMVGRDLEDGEFTFEIYDSHGNKITEATNDENGDIAFSEIPLDTAGTYTLTVKEVAVEEEGLTCDDTVFTVKITVTNTDGVLSAKVEYVDGEIVFENTYDEPTEPTEPEETKPEKPKAPDTGDRAQLGMYTALMVMGMAGMAAMVILPKRKKEN